MNDREILSLPTGYLSRTIAAGVAVLWLASCDATGNELGQSELSHAGHNDAASDERSHDDREPAGHEGEGIRLTAAQIEELGIELATSGPRTIELSVGLTGEVRPNEDRVAHIVPRYDGVVIKVLKKIGDRVRKGDVLAIIESNESLAPYELTTLLDGTVIQKHITRGEAVSREGETFVIADLRTVWIDLSVYQKDLARVALGQLVSISAGKNFTPAEGRISYITPVVDEATRTATARVVLNNRKGAWRPGMFVTGTVRVKAVAAEVAVARSAIQRIGGKTVVFVEDEDGLEPRIVELGRVDKQSAEIVVGLDGGQRYVARGAFILKSELEKEGFEVGHAH